jgi:large subunit ribosomal protein L6
MSRIGKKPIEIPQGVTVEVQKPRTVIVSGPKGRLEFTHRREIGVEVNEKDNHIIISTKSNSKNTQAFWGTTTSLIDNMIEGVCKGFEKKLELNGVGFRMNIQGKKINLALGFSHPVDVEIPEGIDVNIDNNMMIITGIDKQKVGQFAAEIRALKPVEPYKGKGFKYHDEIVKRKEGKKAVGTGA